MKNWCLLMVILGLSFSCGGVKNFDIESSEGIENTKQVIYQSFGKNKKVKFLYLNTMAAIPSVSSNMSSAEITYFENEHTYFQSIYFDSQNELELEEPKQASMEFKCESKETFLIEKVNFEEIPVRIIAAKKLIENPELYTSMCTGFWSIGLDAENKVVHKFRIICQLKKPEDMYSHLIHQFEIDGFGVLRKVDRFTHSDDEKLRECVSL